MKVPYADGFEQLLDFDRHNNALTKLRDKKEKTLNDEKNLFKVSNSPFGLFAH